MPRMTTPDNHPLLTIQAVAERLDLSVKTIRRAVACGDLPAFRIGRSWRIAEDDLRAFLVRRRN